MPEVASWDPVCSQMGSQQATQPITCESPVSESLSLLSRCMQWPLPPSPCPFPLSPFPTPHLQVPCLRLPKFAQPCLQRLLLVAQSRQLLPLRIQTRLKVTHLRGIQGLRVWGVERGDGWGGGGLA